MCRFFCLCNNFGENVRGVDYFWEGGPGVSFPHHQKALITPPPFASDIKIFAFTFFPTINLRQEGSKIKLTPQNNGRGSGTIRRISPFLFPIPYTCTFGEGKIMMLTPFSLSPSIPFIGIPPVWSEQEREYLSIP